MMRILAAVDMTPESNVVLGAAASLAEVMDAKVRLVHVVVPATPFAPMPGMIPATGADPVYGLVEHARARLAAMAHEVPAERRDGRAVEVGAVAETVLRVAAEEHADLVIIGAHGHGALARALGTTAASIVNLAHGPVLVVRRPDGARSPAGEPLRILAAIDSSDMAEAVIARAVAIARSPGARVRLVRVDPLLDHEWTPLEKRGQAADEVRRLELQVPAGRRDGIAILRGFAAAEIICAYAKDYRADIVVIGAHAHGWVARLLGTTAAAVVDRIDRPLFVVHDVTRARSRVELRAEHARLEESYRSLIDSFGSGDWGKVQTEWAAVEPAIRAHMAFEDRVFSRRSVAAVPAYPMDAAALKRQHVELRKQLDRFAIAIEVHSVGQRDAEQMVATLRMHAAREEDVFGRWLEDPPPSALNEQAR